MSDKHYDFHFERKSVANGAVIIEGFSNKNVPDRIKERMHPQGGRLDNYKKNPVVLFDHGKDNSFGVMPVGKGLVTEPQDEGVYTKVRISNSKTDKLTMVRDLIEEDILKTFSLGYETYDETKDDTGVTVLTDWELLEQSIVPVPMNQDSIFSMAKHYQKKHNDFAVSYFKCAMLAHKGAYVAAALHKRVHDLQHGKQLSDVGKAMDMVAEMSGAKVRDIKEVMAGDRPATASVLHAFSVVLGVRENELGNLRKMEPDMSKKVPGKKAVEDPKKEPPKAPPVPPTGKPDEKPANDEDPKKNATTAPEGLVLHSISVPKAMYDEQENAKAFVESHGFKAEQLEEDDECYKFQQNPADDLDMEKAITVDMGDGVKGTAAPRKGAPAVDGKDAPGGGPASAQQLLAESLNCGDDRERAAQLVSQALTMLGGENGDAVIKSVDGKKDDTETPKDGEKAGMPSGDGAVPQDQNPYLQEARQTNALLGTLITEMQKLTAAMSRTEPPKPTESDPPPDDMTAKALELKSFNTKMDQRFKALGY